MPIRFSDYDAVLLDLDGTLLRQDEAMPGAAELVAAVRRDQPRFAILSNSTQGPARVESRLLAAGVPVSAKQIWTAATAACDYVVAKYRGQAKRPPRVFNLATEDVDGLLEGRAELVDPAATQCDAVIVGTPNNARAIDDRQRAALRLLRHGAELVGVCADRIFPSRRGMEFGCGAFCSMLSYASGATPTYCGKPESRFFLELCRRMKAPPERCLLIGDNLEADVLGAKACGIRTILTLGGVTRKQDIEGLNSAMMPDLVVEDLPDLLSSVEAAERVA